MKPRCLGDGLGGPSGNLLEEPEAPDTSSNHLNHYPISVMTWVCRVIMYDANTLMTNPERGFVNSNSSLLHGCNLLEGRD